MMLLTDIVQTVKDSAIEVFRELGSGHSETVYETALELEMRLRDCVGPIMHQVPCPIRYKGHTVGVGYMDLLVDSLLVVELKAVAKLTGRDETQVVKYLLGTGSEHGLLINFNQVSGEVELIDIAGPRTGLLLIPENLPPADNDAAEGEVLGAMQQSFDFLRTTRSPPREGKR